MTTIMQPVQCDLQPRFKKRIELRTQEQPLVAEHRGGTKTTAAAPATHRRYLSSPPAATLHGKMQGLVSCSGFLPNTSVTISLRHHFPSSPLPFVTISLGHHCPSSPPCVIAYYSLVMYCYVMSSLTPPFINVNSQNVYLSVTRKYCFPTSFDYFTNLK